MLSAKISVAGLKETRANLQQANKRLSNPSGFMGYIGAQGLKEINRHFTSEIGPDGRWKALSPTTVARRRQKSSKPLQDTGRLRSSFVWTKLSEKVLQFWSLVDYAEYQNNGTDKIPARPFLWMSSGWVRDMLEKYRKYILRKR